MPLESKEMQDSYAFLFDRWYDASLRLSIATCTTDMDRLFPKAHGELTAWENQIRTKTKLAADEAGIAAKLADYKKFLAENKKDFIASKTYKLDKPIEFSVIKLNYLVNIYFFQ